MNVKKIQISIQIFFYSKASVKLWIDNTKEPMNQTYPFRENRINYEPNPGGFKTTHSWNT